jgi:hypothetical protein
MSRKKLSKAKKVSTNPKKEVDINDIDAMLEDMKNLAMDKPLEEEEKTETENIVQPTEVTTNEVTTNEVATDEVVEDNVEETEESFNKIDLGMDNFELNNDIDDNETLENIQIVFNQQLSENTIEETVENEDEEKEIIIEEKEEQEKPKPKKKSYQEMFGGTWMGYGYDYC